MWKGEDLHQARSVSPHARAPPPPPSFRSTGLVRFRVHPLFFKQTRCLDYFFFPEQTCLLVETPRGIFILLFPIFSHNKNILLTSSSLSFFVRLFWKKVEFVRVLRLRIASEERDLFYHGRQLSTILGTN